MNPLLKTETQCEGCDHPELGEMTMEEAVEGHSFLIGMRDRHLATITSLAQVVTFRENETILECRQLSEYFYLLIAGSVAVSLCKRYCAVNIQTLGPGDAFGWSALLPHHDTLFEVRAMEPCTALRLDGTLLGEALKHDPTLAADLVMRALRLAANRVQASEQRLLDLCAFPVRKPSPDRTR